MYNVSRTDESHPKLLQASTSCHLQDGFVKLCLTNSYCILCPVLLQEKVPRPLSSISEVFSVCQIHHGSCIDTFCASSTFNLYWDCKSFTATTRFSYMTDQLVYKSSLIVPGESGYASAINNQIGILQLWTLLLFLSFWLLLKHLHCSISCKLIQTTHSTQRRRGVHGQTTKALASFKLHSSSPKTKAENVMTACLFSLQRKYPKRACSSIRN